MKYIKIKGNLIDVLGDIARDTKKIGVQFLPQHQMIDENSNISYGKIRNEDLFNITHKDIIIFNTLEEINLDIDKEYYERYVLANIQELQLDLKLSGNPDIPNYRKDLRITDQENLKALFDANMGGIAKNKKAEYFTD